MIELIAIMSCFIASIILTPVVKKLAFAIGAVDRPNHRKVHQRIMPRLGGLAIFMSFVLGFLFFQPDKSLLWPILVGALIIVITGVLDDIFELSAKWKLIGQILAASVVILSDIQITYIDIPFIGLWELGLLSVPFTLLWIVGITNAINLIDGLDGLAAGVSAIVLLAVSTMAILMGDTFVAMLGFILMGSTLGFLAYNFHPAKIFMGDTGALFLGFMISVLAILGFKNITFFSLLVPVIMLGVPISDTFFAIIRRIVNKKPLSAPDKSHLHHCLLNLGLSHRATVLVIYAMAAMFGLVAIVFSQATSTLWVAVGIIVVLLLVIQLIAEGIGLMGSSFKPLLNFFRRVGARR
ncbi:undecaprenyl/decaprenyl-phosphate alpha-N-acetylglucosaminyl 1-phosphate transferase [Bacillaceae bacterium SIJ1]|uniref:glycosyltransferase family 4 protein n=1 Tax=Litoribacterium kuwaitense TaxID=1398745 RepID=UPI0013EC2771|nr:MraY family glycosyltransferase [Litoribacterium kuwaitense]NGP44954.1 undecaprenyl/decaprenyl-phosphate alpha-N-acetylglucosaminyl 1-phosphate transferase [Litoribacterium kuwaitense]